MMKTRTVSDKSAYDDNKMSKKRKTAFLRILMGILFFLYVLCMIYLLFGERLMRGRSSLFYRPMTNLDYWAQVKQHIQLTPLHTIRQYAERVHNGFAFMNLAGNLALFLPMGFFLPYFFRKQKNFICFSLTVILMISCVEITQVLTLLGACDIDDLILNYAGSVIGFILFQILYFMRRKMYAGKRKT